jgi:hypothetical protein
MMRLCSPADGSVAAAAAAAAALLPKDLAVPPLGVRRCDVRPDVIAVVVILRVFRINHLRQTPL